MPSRRILLLATAYVALLLGSHLKRQLDPVTAYPRDGQVLATVPERGHLGEALSGSVQIAYQDIPGDDPSAPVTLLIHGSPVGSRGFEPLIKTIRGHFRIIAPDLPGYDRSTPQVTSGSFPADTAYLRDLLDHLEIPRAHLVAYSRGGGPAIHLAAESPERVASLTLISAIGVQEEELLGDYTLNHALHGAQLLALRILEAAVPHFGYLDNAIFNSAYAKGFFDADQRPLRDLLLRIRQPALIIHGTSDTFVPFAAAREHHRLLPQSESLTIPGAGHLLVIQRPEEIVPPLINFIQRANSGSAPDRSTASAERVAAAIDPVGYVPSPLAPSALAFIIVILIVSTLVSEDITCIVAGLLVAKGTLDFATATAACFTGILIGDMLLFLAGRWFGKPVLGRRPLRWLISPAQVDRAATWFKKRGAVVIFASRFVPGARLPTYVIAGSVGVNPSRFFLYFATAAALWTPAVVALAWFVGAPALDFFEKFSGHAVVALVIVVLGLFLCIKLLFPVCSHRGRRMLLGRWLRLTRWEFWPSWRIYATVLPWILWRSWRTGGTPVLCTVTNPAFPCSGLVHESKIDILTCFQGLPELPAWAPIRQSDSAEKKLATLRQIAAASPSRKIVLKPDSGQRGSGVRILEHPHEWDEAIARLTGDGIVQVFVEGVEMGIFYIREPGDPIGRITSLTRKQPTTVVGNGQHTLERLILDNPDTVASAHILCAENRERLLDIPAEGQVVQLTTVGAHARGTTFEDGIHHLTPDLTAKVDQIARQVDGFHYGRFDFKAPDWNSFEKGEDLSIIELNGLSSEPTHMYATGTPWRIGQRSLRQHWAAAIRIAKANLDSGHQPWKIRQVLNLAFGKRDQRPTNPSKNRAQSGSCAR